MEVQIGETLNNLNGMKNSAFGFLNKFKDTLEVTIKKDISILSDLNMDAHLEGSKLQNISSKSSNLLNNLLSTINGNNDEANPASTNDSVISVEDQENLNIENLGRFSLSNVLLTPKSSFRSSGSKQSQGSSLANSPMSSDSYSFVDPFSESNKPRQQNNESPMLRKSFQDSNPDSYKHYRALMRKPTAITCSFPLKPFERMTTQTIDIPGLNVHTIQYNVIDDLGKLEPELYMNTSSLGSEQNLSICKGKIYFSIYYNNQSGCLVVRVNKAELINRQNKPDTFVKLRLLPGKKEKYQTHIQRRTCTPVFEETFYFQIPFNDLLDKTLCLSFYECARFSKQELISTVKVNNLDLIEKLSEHNIELVRDLNSFAEFDEERGELTLSLCYLPAAGRLTVTIIQASNLKALDLNGKSDPYVKVNLICKGKCLKKKKSSVIKNTRNPVFNESMLFNVPQDIIKDVDVVVKVMDYDSIGFNELIGCVGIGSSFGGLGKDHWTRILETPRKPITRSYYLTDISFLRDIIPAKGANKES